MTFSCNSQKTHWNEHQGRSCAEGSFSASVFKPVFVLICLISEHRAKCRSLQRTTSESQVCWGYHASQWARSKRTTKTKSRPAPPLNAQLPRVGELWAHSITICSSHPCWLFAKYSILCFKNTGLWQIRFKRVFPLVVLTRQRRLFRV